MKKMAWKVAEKEYVNHGSIECPSERNLYNTFTMNSKHKSHGNSYSLWPFSLGHRKRTDDGFLRCRLKCSDKI